MPLQFSSGLLSSLGSYGQGDGNIPTDPNQRTMMQQLGVTNPLLQAFGQGISSATGNGSRPVQIGGATIGLDNRSAMDQFKAAASNLDVSSPEGRVEYLKALQRINPEAAVKQLMAFKKMDQDDALFKLKEAIDTRTLARDERNIYVPVTKMVKDPSDLTGMRTIPSTSYIMVTVDKDNKPVMGMDALVQAGVDPTIVGREEVAWVPNKEGKPVMVRRAATDKDFKDEQGNSYSASEVITQQQITERKRREAELRSRDNSVLGTPQDDWRLAP